MTLTSSGLETVDGGLVFPAAASAPMNQSPQLAWSTAPAGTLSFAITLRNLSTSNTQWVAWNIPATTTMVPANISRVIMPFELAGGLQKSASGDTIGYEGPAGDVVEDYELQVWALKVAKVTTMTPNDLYTTALPAQKLDVATIRAKGKRNGL